MLFVQVVQAVAALAVLSNAMPAPSSHILHEKRHALPRGYVKGSRIDSEAFIPIRIGLAQNNINLIEEHLMTLSHPSSKDYGKHWTAEDVRDFFAPTDYTIGVVRNWLIDSGIGRERIGHSQNKGWVVFDASIAEAEALFHTEYYEHHHETTGAVRIGCDEYHILKHLQDHIDYITPGVQLSPPVRRIIAKRWGQNRKPGGPHRQPGLVSDGASPKWFPPWNAHLPAELQNCGRNITPTCIKALYHIPNAPAAVPGNSFGIFEQGDFYAQEDLDRFFAAYAPNVPAGTHPQLDSVDGATAPVAVGSEFEGVESAIDFDLAYALTYPQPLILYQVDDLNYATNSTLTGFSNTWLDAIDGSYCVDVPGIDPPYPDLAPGGYKGQLMCGVYAPTKVVSISYGVAEADRSPSYAYRQCAEYAKLGLQGITIILATGDYGVASYPGDGSDNGCLGPNSTIFNPDALSSCPYITAVGGTRLYDNQTVLDAESVTQYVNRAGSLSSSHGGFSNYFTRPTYQDSAVSHYFATADPGYPYYHGNVHVNKTGGLYNRDGRGFPDVAANGYNLGVYFNNTLHHYRGTSLSAPIFASMITLINGQRLLKGKSTVGLINPVLYAHPLMFNDIVNGTNPGCGTKGFAAAKGWDPSTGLGTPDYPKMLEVFMSLP